MTGTECNLPRMGACVSSDNGPRDAHASAPANPSHQRPTDRAESEPPQTSLLTKHDLQARQQTDPDAANPAKQLTAAESSQSVAEVEQPETPEQGETLSNVVTPQQTLSQQQLLDTLTDWQEQHDSQRAELTNQLLLQSQEISKLRDQIIDLQAFRQHQQRQQQRAAYIKSKMFPKYDEQGLGIPSDCCAAAMACCLAIEELKNDLKIEGQIISKQFETLMLLRNHKNGSFLAKTAESLSQPDTASACTCTHDASHSD